MGMTKREILDGAKIKMNSLEADQVLEAKSMLESIPGYENADGLAEQCDEISQTIARRDESLSQILMLSNKILKRNNDVKNLKIACIVFGVMAVVAGLPMLIAGAVIKLQALLLAGVIIANAGFIGMICCLIFSLMRTNEISVLLVDKSECEKTTKQIYSELEEYEF